MTLVVVGHDAGGAELMCAFVKEHLDRASWHMFCPASSPMAAIAKKQGLQTTEPFDIDGYLSALSFDALLFGTGWQEQYERPFVQYAKAHAISTVAFLDHWTKYRERFGFPEDGWEANLPDITAAHDEKALHLARELYLPRPIPLPNYYLKRVAQEAKEQPIQSTLLFFGEPTDRVAEAHYGDENYWGFTQYSALQDILENFEIFGCDSLSVRLHPSEKSGGYKKVLKRFPHIRSHINDANAFGLSEQIMQSKVIIGFDTMALYVAAHLNKPVISYLPSRTRDFMLPLPASHRLRDLSALKPLHLQPLMLYEKDFGMDFASFAQLIEDCNAMKTKEVQT